MGFLDLFKKKKTPVDPRKVDDYRLKGMKALEVIYTGDPQTLAAFVKLGKRLFSMENVGFLFAVYQYSLLAYLRDNRGQKLAETTRLPRFALHQTHVPPSFAG